MFVPALSGLACPHWDRFAFGLWIGLSQDTDRNSMMQSILEGTALCTAEMIRTMSSLTEVGHEIFIEGGVSVRLPWQKPRRKVVSGNHGHRYSKTGRRRRQSSRQG